MMDNNTNINSANGVSEQAQQVINKLYFNAREWHFNKDCPKNTGNRSFMEGPDGVIAEAFTIGNWGYDWTEICTKQLVLPKNTLHTFTFWLNGGENDNNNEVCRFEVIFNNDYENRYTYNLNRSFIKPLKKLNGWELYEIPFYTENNEYTELRFVAQRAYMTVLAAKDASEYANLADTPDKFEQYRPQRHNIVFADGFPTDEWYSTRELERRYGDGAGKENALKQPTKAEIFPPLPHTNVFTGNASTGRQAILNGMQELQASFEGMKQEAIEAVRNSASDCSELSEDEIEDMISEVVGNVEEAYNDAMESLKEALESLNDLQN